MPAAGGTFTLLKQATSLYVSHPGLSLIALAGAPFVILDTFSRTNLWLALLGASLWFVVLFFVLAALAYSSSELLAGRQPSILDSYRRVAQRYWALSGIMVAHFLGVVVPFGILIGIPLGVYLLVRWWFGLYAVVLKDVSAGEALRISSSLVKGAWWQTFGRTVAVMTAVGLSATAIGILLGPIAGYLVVVPHIIVLLLLPLPTAFYTIQFLNATGVQVTKGAASR